MTISNDTKEKVFIEIKDDSDNSTVTWVYFPFWHGKLSDIIKSAGKSYLQTIRFFIVRDGKEINITEING